jgi:Major Facilitator Superfamily
MTTAQEYLEKRWTALILLCVAQFIVVLDASIVNVALPSIGKGLNFSEANLPWIVNAYVIAFGGFLLLGGRAADLLGRRRVFMTGLAVVGIASLPRGPRKASAPRSSPRPPSPSSRRCSRTVPSATRPSGPGAPSPARPAPRASCWAASSPTASAGSGCCG